MLRTVALIATLFIAICLPSGVVFGEPVTSPGGQLPLPIVQPLPWQRHPETKPTPATMGSFRDGKLVLERIGSNTFKAGDLVGIKAGGKLILGRVFSVQSHQLTVQPLGYWVSDASRLVLNPGQEVALLHAQAMVAGTYWAPADDSRKFLISYVEDPNPLDFDAHLSEEDFLGRLKGELWRKSGFEEPDKWRWGDVGRVTAVRDKKVQEGVEIKDIVTVLYWSGHGVEHVTIWYIRLRRLEHDSEFSAGEALNKELGEEINKIKNKLQK